MTRTEKLLRDKLRVLHITQREAARRCGMSAPELGLYVNGKRVPNLKHIDKIAKGFGIAPRRVFDAALEDLRHEKVSLP